MMGPPSRKHSIFDDEEEEAEEEEENKDDEEGIYIDDGYENIEGILCANQCSSNENER